MSLVIRCNVGCRRYHVIMMVINIIIIIIINLVILNIIIIVVSKTMIRISDDARKKE